MLGLIEGEFPAKATESAPYTIHEREQLRGAGFDLTELPADAGADLSQFYKAMSKAADKFYLSYARTDLAGGELLPSYLVEEVKSVAAAQEIRISYAAFDDLRLQEMAPASLEELAGLTAKALRGHIADEVSTEMLEDFHRDAHELLKRELPSWAATIRGAAIEQKRIRQSRGIYDGLVSARDLLDNLGKAFGDDHHWSASQINDYGACPFRFFAKHVLRLSPAVEPKEGFASNQLGHAYHEILEQLYSKLKNSDTQLNDETISQVVEQAAEIAENVLEKKRERGEIRKGSFWDFEKSEIKKRIARLLQKEAEWNRERPARPTHFERTFGFGHQPPLVIKSSDVQVRIRGVIDRIDECEDGCIIIDYKTGRTPISHRDALDGRNLQLPIYVMAASRVVNPGRKVASAYYLHINSRKKGSELPRKSVDLSLDELISLAEGRIVDYVKRARGGQFPIAPNGGRCYQGCEFDVVCRIQSIGSTVSSDKEEHE